MKTQCPNAAIIAITLAASILMTQHAIAQNINPQIQTITHHTKNTNTNTNTNTTPDTNRQNLTPQPTDKLPIAWENHNGIIRLSKSQRDKNAFWYPNTELTTNGTLYATMKMGKKPDSSIMYRATFPQNPALVSGYSLSFDHQYVLIHRWENGFAVPITGMTKVKKWPEQIDIIIKMNGPHVNITILNAKSKAQLAHLESNDATFKGKQTGYRIYRKQDKITGFTHLSFEPAPTTHFPNTQHPDAYIRQHPNMYVMAPKNKKNTPALQHCKPLKYDDFIENYDIYKCGNKAMMMLVNKDRLLPNGFFWTEPRTAFTDDEFRKAYKDIKCNIPMRCNPKAPIHPNKSAKDAAMTYAYLDAYVDECKKRYKYVRLETIGQTYLGYDIKAIVLSNSPPDTQKPRVLFNGAHHGMELLSIDMTFDILEQICENTDKNIQKQYENTLNHIEAWIIPTVNLDGNDMFMHVSNHLGRKNGRGVFLDNTIDNTIDTNRPIKYGPVKPHMGFYRYRPNAILIGAGVDINRNYPLEWGATGENSTSSRPRDYWYRGTAPASEPEIQAMMNLFHTQQFAASISFHTVSTKILVPYSIESLKNPIPEQDNAWQLALKMANAAGTQASGKPYQVVNNLYAVDGTDQDWFRMIAGTYAYLIEGALHNPTGNERTKALTQNRPAWQTLFHAVPASTIVRVTDNNQQPLIAEVSYSDIPKLNQEHWLTRCQDGTHTLLCFGERTITVKLSDGTTQSKTVKCNAQTPTIVDFVFQKPLQYNLENATINSGVRTDLLGIDAICHMRNGTCPQLPANQFCLIQNECIQAGKTKKLENGQWGQCQPRENNRNWTPLNTKKIQINIEN